MLHKDTVLWVIASGDGTRMADYTLNGALPKLLLSVGQQTVLDNIITQAQEAKFVSINIVVKTEHIDMCKDIVALRHKDADVNFYGRDIANGTAKTIADILKLHVYDSDVNNGYAAMFMWSDIIVEQGLHVALEQLEKATFEPDTQMADIVMLTDNNARHRFNFDSAAGFTRDDVNSKGNVAGVFYVRNLHALAQFLYYSSDTVDACNDIVEVFSVWSSNGYALICHTSTDFIDIGDPTKYTAYVNTIDINTRFFNQIEFTDNTVTKRPACDKGVSVMLNEIAMYKWSEANNGPFAKVISSSTVSNNVYLTIERLYETVHQYCERTNIVDNITMLSEIYKEFCMFVTSTLHSKQHTLLDGINEQEWRDSALNEYVALLEQRTNSVRHILSASTDFVNIDKVNGVSLQTKLYESHVLLNRLYDCISQCSALNSVNSAAVIHGDPNTSNVMFKNSVNGEFALIDPRGYWGNYKIIGDKHYDFAKFAYGLSGYSQFNNNKNFVARIDKSNLLFDEVNVDLDTLVHDPFVKLLIGVIWLKLPAYIANNPLKSICAYAKGFQMTDKYLRELGY